MPYKDKNKQLEYQRRWMAKRRQEWLDANGPCVLCGSSDRLQVDHIDTTNKISHRIWSWTQEKREKELAKCRALCYSCHRKKSNTEVPKGEKHYRSRLTANDVRAMRRDYKPFVPGFQLKDLAQKYNVTWRHVQDIIRGDRWKHVK